MSVPHWRCCIILNLPWLNKHGCKPWNPHPGTNFGVAFCSPSPHCCASLGSTSVWGGRWESGRVSVFPFHPLAKNGAVAETLFQGQLAALPLPLTRSLQHLVPSGQESSSHEAEGCEDRSLAVSAATQSARKAPFDYLPLSIYPCWKWVDFHPWGSVKNLAALYLWLL